MLHTPNRKWLANDAAGRAIAYIIKRAKIARRKGWELSPEMLHWDEFYNRPPTNPDLVGCLAARRRLNEHNNAS